MDEADMETNNKIEALSKRSSNIFTGGPTEKHRKQDPSLAAKLIPILEGIYKKPESEVFRQSVDTVIYTSYRTVVQNPMDFSTIIQKLKMGEYRDEWDVIYDFNLMLDNAYLFNKKTSNVIKNAVKIRKVFDDEMDSVMKEDYCCCKMRSFRCELVCSGTESCIIHYDQQYYTYKDETQARFEYCCKCFKKFKKGPIVVESEGGSIEIEKAKFELKVNHKVDPEKFVTCKICLRRYHEICVLYNEEIWINGFICAKCLVQTKQTSREENPFTAKKLKQNILGGHMEDHVNKFLQSKSPGSENVIIRVLSSIDKIFDVEPQMKRKYVDSGEFSASFSYRSKAIFAFQEIDGIEVCFFGMNVQEYGADCPAPNSRCIYLAYLDSVNFFSPKELRTEIYYQIILSYLDAVRSRLFKMIYIWACPPNEGDDYIFHHHPPSQKIPSATRLYLWYNELVEKGIRADMIDYKENIRKYVDSLDNKPLKLPYFDGDWWPTALESIIPTSEAEEENLLSVQQKFDVKTKTYNRNNGCKSNGQKPQTVFTRIMNEHIHNVKDVVLVAFLKKHKNNLADEIMPDPDKTFKNDLVDDRDALLDFLRENHCEFSSLRLAKFSTICFLKKLHDSNYFEDI